MTGKAATACYPLASTSLTIITTTRVLSHTGCMSCEQVKPGPRQGRKEKRDREEDMANSCHK